MAKIIKIMDDQVFVGKDDGSLVTFDRNEFSSEPYVGGEVDVWTDGGKRIATLKNPRSPIKLAKEGLAEEVSPKSRQAAFLLCLFLGGFGVHDFYVGKYGNGAIILILLGLIFALAGSFGGVAGVGAVWLLVGLAGFPCVMFAVWLGVVTAFYGLEYFYSLLGAFGNSAIFQYLFVQSLFGNLRESLGVGMFWLVLLAIWSIWIFIEWILILIGHYNDGEGLPVTEW